MSRGLRLFLLLSCSLKLLQPLCQVCCLLILGAAALMLGLQILIFAGQLVVQALHNCSWYLGTWVVLLARACTEQRSGQSCPVQQQGLQFQVCSACLRCCTHNACISLVPMSHHMCTVVMFVALCMANNASMCSNQHSCFVCRAA